MNKCLLCVRNHCIKSLIPCYYCKRNIHAYKKLFSSMPYDMLNCEPHREKTGLLPMRKQRRRSASQ